MVAIPVVSMGQRIPRIIHQAFPTKNLPPPIQTLVDNLRRENPTWEHRLYDSAGMASFIGTHYGEDVLRRFESIDERYGAARVDLWRYLVIYKLGGVYLDIKSTFSRPLDEVIQDDDRYILSCWDQSPGSEFSGFGLHRQLSHRAGGEFQQWHVIGVQGHPFLHAVVERVLTNIDRYNPWRDGSGKIGVLKMTGPVAYTLAIEPLLDQYPHRLMNNERSLSLVYNPLGGITYHSYLPRHYSLLKIPIVKQGLISQSAYPYYRRLKDAYVAMRRLKQRAFS